MLHIDNEETSVFIGESWQYCKDFSYSSTAQTSQNLKDVSRPTASLKASVTLPPIQAQLCQSRLKSWLSQRQKCTDDSSVKALLQRLAAEFNRKDVDYAFVYCLQAAKSVTQSKWRWRWVRLFTHCLTKVWCEARSLLWFLLHCTLRSTSAGGQLCASSCQRPHCHRPKCSFRVQCLDTGDLGFGNFWSNKYRGLLHAAYLLHAEGHWLTLARFIAFEAFVSLPWFVVSVEYSFNETPHNATICYNIDQTGALKGCCWSRAMGVPAGLADSGAHLHGRSGDGEMYICWLRPGVLLIQWVQWLNHVEPTNDHQTIEPLNLEGALHPKSINWCPLCTYSGTACSSCTLRDASALACSNPLASGSLR